MHVRSGRKTKRKNKIPATSTEGLSTMGKVQRKRKKKAENPERGAEVEAALTIVQKSKRPSINHFHGV